MALSSGESEFIAMVGGGTEVVYLKECLEFLAKESSSIDAVFRSDSAARRGISQRIGCGRSAILTVDCFGCRMREARTLRGAAQTGLLFILERTCRWAIAPLSAQGTQPVVWGETWSTTRPTSNSVGENLGRKMLHPFLVGSTRNA